MSLNLSRRGRDKRKTQSSLNQNQSKVEGEEEKEVLPAKQVCFPFKITRVEKSGARQSKKEEQQDRHRFNRQGEIKTFGHG